MALASGLVGAMVASGGDPGGGVVAARAVVGPQGGRVAVGTQLVLDVPRGALAAPVEIVIRRFETSDAVGDGGEGVLYSFEPAALRFGVPATLSVASGSARLGRLSGGRVEPVLLTPDAQTGRINLLLADLGLREVRAPAGGRAADPVPSGADGPDDGRQTAP